MTNAIVIYLNLVFVMSFACFVAYGCDKRRRANGSRRVPRQTLHILALLGGWPGALLGQRHFRHKTKKLSFLIAFGCLVVLYVAIVGTVIVPWRVERSPHATEDMPMKLHCPTCNRPVDIGHASRYEVFACACGRRFRGIHAEECLADYLFWKFAGVPTRLMTFGLFGRLDTNKLTRTRCPYCDAEIGISYSRESFGVTGPSHCWACTNKLPTEPVNNLK